MSKLVVSRKPGERLLIGENIIVTVVRASKYSIRIAVEAPSEVRIVREELVQKQGVKR
jgi:carbon storage regulator